MPLVDLKQLLLAVTVDVGVGVGKAGAGAAAHYNACDAQFLARVDDVLRTISVDFDVGLGGVVRTHRAAM